MPNTHNASSLNFALASWSLFFWSLLTFAGCLFLRDDFLAAPFDTWSTVALFAVPFAAAAALAEEYYANLERLDSIPTGK